MTSPRSRSTARRVPSGSSGSRAAGRFPSGAGGRGDRFSRAAGDYNQRVTEEPRKSSEEPAESGALESYPPEGEQERSAESEETLSPDEKSSV